MTDLDADGYEKAIAGMQAAGAAWLKSRPFAEPRFRTQTFEQELAREAGKPGERPAIISNLGAVIDRWADNEDARLLLRAMDAAAQGQGTYLQAKAIIEAAQLRALERAQGQLGAGDWRCTGCRTVLDGFTNIYGDAVRPDAGSLSVCAYCAVLQQVNETRDGYTPLSTRELNQLPKPVRKQLLAARNAIEERIAKEGARS